MAEQVPIEPFVSIVIAACDAEDTLGETLASVQAQREPDWEVVVVDDGSVDATYEIASAVAAADQRVRVLSQRWAGVSAARNAGIAAARGAWLLLLDADDWLEAEALALLKGAVRADPTADAAYGAWARVTVTGRVLDGLFWADPGTLFQGLASHCVLPIHSCLFRRTVIDAVGSLDTTLTTCEDWDFWQRVARSGARFAAVPERVARYRVRPGSASLNTEQMLADAVRVIERGHGPDPRVRNPKPACAAGRPREELSAAVVGMVSWCAGTVIARGGDAEDLIRFVKAEGPVDVDPASAAASLLDAFDALGGGPCDGSAADGIDARIHRFFAAVEQHCQSPGWGRRALRALERRSLEPSEIPRRTRVGRGCAVAIEVTSPFVDVEAPSGSEHLQCELTLEGERLGRIELPICDGVVPAGVVTDAVAAAAFWPVLGHFFGRTLYPGMLAVDADDGGWALRRGDIELAGGPDGVPAAIDEIHDRAGWTVFLQELWGRPEWSDERFYEGGEGEAVGTAAPTATGWHVIEVSAPPVDLEAPAGDVRVVLEVGGAAVCHRRLQVTGDMPFARAGDVRAALTMAAGLELCRVAVREAVLGRPLDASGSLRERLAAGTARRTAGSAALIDLPLAARPAPGWEQTLAASNDRRPARILAARPGGGCGTSASRRSALPVAAVGSLDRAANAAGELAISAPTGTTPQRVIYEPGLLWCREQGEDAPNDPDDRSPHQPARAEHRRHDRHSFEALFSTSPDPWRYESPYEQGKHVQTLSLLPGGRTDRALEVGCAEGHFTVQLAPRVRQLVAADISRVALERAAARCHDLGNVSFVPLDLTTDELPGRYDLIVTSEVLYYLGDRAGLEDGAARLVASLNPGGHLIAAHVNALVDEPTAPGFEGDLPYGARAIGEVFSAIEGVEPLTELRTQYYRIQLFRKRRRAPVLHRRRTGPRVIEAEALAPPPDTYAEEFRAEGGRPDSPPPPAEIATDRLPILMYHRVADVGPVALEPYRLSAQVFDEQLAYLRSAGFISVTLDQWRDAVALRRPLPGRGVCLTFDDGYRDFLTDAWPILQRHGFTASVFLVTDSVGDASRWDDRFGPAAPLLGWDEIADLERDGVRFGSHTASHRALTGLAPAEAADELARSRAVAYERLHHPLDAVAYPYGDVDALTAHLAGGCGYTFGLTCRPGRSALTGDLLLLPRSEVTRSLDMAGFISALER